ncbi:IreB family regulatory phosphoprotein [Natroniella sp. ANB-PHB2]|uniref:IreB family regulatory phosphoprotein n=1 Tax=Natroniella sp. ANB-PHB2 TaxID=3384444 RepID=UPI0038D47DCE
MSDMDKTMMFRVEKDDENEVARVLRKVYQALDEKGYNPIDQIVGYILSGDPAYITSHRQARSKIRKFERDEIIEELVKSYLK